MFVSVNSFNLWAWESFWEEEEEEGAEELELFLELESLKDKSVKPTCFDTVSSLRKWGVFSVSDGMILREFDLEETDGEGTQSSPK